MKLQRVEDIHLTGAECVFAKGQHDKGEFAQLVAIELQMLIDADYVEYTSLRWVPLRNCSGVYDRILHHAEPNSRGSFIATFYDVEWHGVSEVPSTWQPEWAPQDTTVSGYSLDPQDTCLCRATDTLDCQRHGCHAIDGHRQHVADIDAGRYDDVAEAAAEREGLDGFDPADFAVGTEALMRGPYGG